MCAHHAVFRGVLAKVPIRVLLSFSASFVVVVVFVLCFVWGGGGGGCCFLS